MGITITGISLFLTSPSVVITSNAGDEGIAFLSSKVNKMANPSTIMIKHFTTFILDSFSAIDLEVFIPYYIIAIVYTHQMKTHFEKNPLNAKLIF